VGVKGLAGISDMIETGHLLEESLPELAGELKLLLATAGEEELASQISSLRLTDVVVMIRSVRPVLCSTSRGSWRPRHKTICLNPSAEMTNVDVVDGKVVEIEVLYRDDFRDKLLSVLPRSQPLTNHSSASVSSL